MTQTGTSIANSDVINEIHEQLRPLFDPQANSIPVLRATCQKILNISGDTSSPDALAEVVSRDPGLTCKVLQIANGIAYSPQHTLTSVTHAVAWLGLDTVRTLVATVQLMEQLENQPGQLFSAALLYSFADLVIAYQTPDLFQELIAAKTQDEEIKILGVSRVRFATALAKTWVLPAGLMDLIGSPAPTAKTKWQTDQKLFMGLVTGSKHLVAAMADAPNPGAADPIRRTVQRGTALPERTLQDALTRAFDKGRQLSRSVGITETVISQASAPAAIAVMLSATTNPELSKGGADGSKAAPPIQTRPLETLQQFQTSLMAAGSREWLWRC